MCLHDRREYRAGSGVIAPTLRFIWFVSLRQSPAGTNQPVRNGLQLDRRWIQPALTADCGDCTTVHSRSPPSAIAFSPGWQQRSRWSGSMDFIRLAAIPGIIPIQRLHRSLSYYYYFCCCCCCCCYFSSSSSNKEEEAGGTKANGDMQLAINVASNSAEKIKRDGRR